MTTQKTNALVVILTVSALGCSDPTPEVQYEPVATANVERADAGSQARFFAADAGQTGGNALFDSPIAVQVPSPAVAVLEQPSSTLTVVDAAMTTALESRSPVDRGSVFTADGSRVWAWVSVENRDEPGEIQMVWKKNGKAVNVVKLDVGVSPAWRTWSYKTLRKLDAGSWTVDVLDARDHVLETLAFEVREDVKS
jgi:hypothetical protein